ncbi:hypothetical protein [Methanospirillum sp.]
MTISPLFFPGRKPVPDDIPGPDCIRQKQQGVCQKIDVMVSDYAEAFCGKITLYLGLL